MSVFVTLSTSKSPDLGDIIEFAKVAQLLGLDPKNLLVARSSGPHEISVVVPIEHLPVVSDSDDS